MQTMKPPTEIRSIEQRSFNRYNRITDPAAYFSFNGNGSMLDREMLKLDNVSFDTRGNGSDNLETMYEYGIERLIVSGNDVSYVYENTIDDMCHDSPITIERSSNGFYCIHGSNHKKVEL